MVVVSVIVEGEVKLAGGVRRARKKEETICWPVQSQGSRNRKSPQRQGYVLDCTRFERVKVGWLDEEGVREL